MPAQGSHPGPMFTPRVEWVRAGRDASVHAVYRLAVARTAGDHDGDNGEDGQSARLCVLTGSQDPPAPRLYLSPRYDVTDSTFCSALPSLEKLTTTLLDRPCAALVTSILRGETRRGRRPARLRAATTRAPRCCRSSPSPKPNPADRRFRVGVVQQGACSKACRQEEARRCRGKRFPVSHGNSRSSDSRSSSLVNLAFAASLAPLVFNGPRKARGSRVPWRQDKAPIVIC